MTRARLEALIGGAESSEEWRDRPEADRLAFVRGYGGVPDECAPGDRQDDDGPGIAPAIARGAVRSVDLQAVYLRGDGELDRMHAGYRGRSTLVVMDVFDRMAVQAKRKKKTIPLTKAQIEMGRTYSKLMERRQSGDVRCSSMEGSTSGQGSAGFGITDAQLHTSRQIDRWHGAIGSGYAMKPKRSVNGRQSRQAIPLRALVDAVCVEDMEVAKILRRFGWPVNGRNTSQAFKALGAAFDRMQGDPITGRIRSLRTFPDPEIFGGAEKSV